MGMTISEAISKLRYELNKNNKMVNAYVVAINTMCKYQKIEQALNSWNMNCINDREFINTIREVLEDGKHF